MTLKYFQASLSGFTNNTDEFIVLVGYSGYLYQPLVSGENYWNIQVSSAGEVIDEVGENVLDNGLTQTYMQVNTGNWYKKRLLIPPSCKLTTGAQNGDVYPFGEFIQGTLEEVAKLL